jgi:hypothetical protein
MLALLQETTAVGEQNSGAISTFLADPIYPAWAAAIFALLLLIPEIIKAGRWLRWRWETRHLPRNTQAHKDRTNYERLLQKYESYLIILENLIVLRSQIQAGPDPFTPELKEKLVKTRDHVSRELEHRSNVEKDMGIFQLLDVLEGRMVAIADLRRKREDLEKRQGDIEKHPLFIKRGSS